MSLTYSYIEKGAPLYHGEKILNGLSSQVVVSFDDEGVPSVVAETESDAFFAQGYIHANDRLWQMNLSRQRARGTLSEIFGKSQLSSDVWFRTLNLTRAAEQAFESLDPAAQQALIAYSEGVNAYIEHMMQLPPEYLMLDIKEVEQWSPIDSLLIHKLMALTLSGNMFDELQRMRTAGVVPKDDMHFFYPFDSAPETLLTSELSTLSLVQGGEEAKVKHDRQRFVGSNAWAVSGKLTASGDALLANDPHLSIAAPAIWYQMDMQGGQLNVSGFSLVGLPGITSGANQHIGWGFTSLIADQQDLYIYDSSSAFDETVETIRVRRPFFESLQSEYEEVQLRVKNTDYGPIVSDINPGTGVNLAFRWVGLEQEDKSFEAIYKLQFAKDWTSFRDALRVFKSPGLDFLYADKNGNIGLQAAGHFPVRVGATGILPQHAAEESALWFGVHNFEDLPSQYNPELGYIVSANEHKVLPDGSAISYESAPGYRFNRISQLLNDAIRAGDLFTIESMASMQLDTVDLSVQPLHQLMTQEKVYHAIEQSSTVIDQTQLKHLLKTFSEWDYAYAKESVAATLYHYWLDAIKGALVGQSTLPNEIDTSRAHLFNVLLTRLSGSQLAEYIDEKFPSCSESTGEDNKCVNLLSSTFNAALSKIIRETQSSNYADWQWQNLHFVEFSNMVFSENPVTDSLWNERRVAQGSEYSVNAANAVANNEGGYQQTYGVSFRMIQEFGEEVVQHMTLPTGQSGHIFSPYFERDKVSADKQVVERSQLILKPMELN
ncbi:penicillin acylase family protein [Pseudoalteromonas umbrosa]|uniref:penicillin acylase family protein n=1 Tax=Pseudoalteromonas umbrosa TaxID=3048489 RepID=UPI0024C27A7B|nr:penicillin acylase family protein [Pseudoalteromonas sp. B95]